MKKILSAIFTLAVCAQFSFGQIARPASSLQTVQKEVSEMKKESLNAAAPLTPADFNDTASFGIRADVNGPVQQAFYFYTFRLLGN